MKLIEILTLPIKESTIQQVEQVYLSSNQEGFEIICGGNIGCKLAVSVNLVKGKTLAQRFTKFDVFKEEEQTQTELYDNQDQKILTINWFNEVDLTSWTQFGDFEPVLCSTIMTTEHWGNDEKNLKHYIQ